MADDRTALAGLSRERVALPDGFAVAPAVRRAAAAVPTVVVDRVDALCSLCGQVVMPLSRKGIAYQYSYDQAEGAVLAHLIQAHGWTRETIGEH